MADETMFGIVDQSPASCPKCGSTSILVIHMQDSLESCLSCKAVWESIPCGEKYLRDGEMMPWKDMCDNCAFRRGSPESKNKKEWRALMKRLKSGGKFFCHKGVPMMFSKHGDTNTAFDFPQKEGGEYDQSRMRLCRGYLNAWIKWTNKG
jgi:hypothetical protein